MARVTRGDVLTITCQTCKTSFTYVFKQGHPRRYCSQRCQDNRQRSAVAVVTCPVCDEPFGKTRERITYCSKSCAARGVQRAAALDRNPSSPVPWIQCPCGRWIVGRRTRRYCSEACVKDTARIRAGYTAMGTPRLVTCKQCDVQFRYKSTTRPKEFCTTACRKAWAKALPDYQAKQAERRSRPNYRMQRKASESRRRARKRGAQTESFTHVEIFERDAWRCGLCGKSVLRSAKAPHPRSPSLDHIVPLAKGGDHTRANVQCACFGCNSRKGDRLLSPEQLRLVG